VGGPYRPWNRWRYAACALGFSLDEVRLLLTLADAKHCAETNRTAAAKLETVNGKLAALAACRKRSGNW
jgi:MerR, DNA binding